MEADYEVATARGNLRSIDLFASVGYTGQDRDLTSAYKGLLDNQIVQVGVKVPILDWGKRRGKVRVAKRSGAFQNPAGTDGLQSGYFPARSELQ